MAVPVVGNSQTDEVNNGTSITITKPTSTVDTDLLLAFVVVETTGTFDNVPSGWTTVFDDTFPGTASTRGWVAYKLASSEGANYTWDWTGNRDAGGRIFRVTGHDTTTPVDQVETFSEGSSNNPNTAGLTTDEADNLVFAWHIASAAAGVSGLTADTGWNLEISEAYGGGGDQTSLMVESKEVDSTASGTTAPDGAGGSYDWAASQFAVQPTTDVTIELEAKAPGVAAGSTVAGPLKLVIETDATSATTSTAAGPLKLTIKAGATSAATSTVTASLDTFPALDATSAATSAATASLKLIEKLTATSAATSTVAGPLKLIEKLAATSAAGSAVTADLTVQLLVPLDATSAATSAVTANLKLIEKLGATPAAGSAVTANLKLIEKLAATSAAGSAVAADLTVQVLVPLDATIAATSTVAGPLKLIVKAGATSAATSAVPTADLSVTTALVELDATIAATSAVTADLSVTGIDVVVAKPTGFVIFGGQFRERRRGRRKARQQELKVVELSASTIITPAEFRAKMANVAPPILPRITQAQKDFGDLIKSIEDDRLHGLIDSVRHKKPFLRPVRPRPLTISEVIVTRTEETIEVPPWLHKRIDIPRAPVDVPIYKAVTDAELLAIADRMEPAMRAAFLEAIAFARDSLDSDAVVRAFQAGRIEEAMRLIRVWLETLQIPISTTATLIGAAQAAAGIGGLRFLDPLLEAWAEATSDTLIGDLSAGAQTTVSNIITRGMAGRDVRATGRVLRSVVGLLPQHIDAVFRYEDRLLKQGLPPARIAKLVETYSNRLLAWRSEMIARTETMRATNMGRLLLWREMIEQGVLDADELRLRWIVTPDDRLCPFCAPMEGKIIDWGEQFQSTHFDNSIKPNKGKRLQPLVKALQELPHGPKAVWAPPLHPMCRCVVVLDRTDEFDVEPILVSGTSRA